MISSDSNTRRVISRYSFKTGLSISRIREYTKLLEDAGYIKRSSEGYRITEEGKKALEE